MSKECGSEAAATRLCSVSGFGLAAGNLYLMQSGVAVRTMKALSVTAIAAFITVIQADYAFAQAEANPEGLLANTQNYWVRITSWIAKEYAEAPALVIAGGVALCAPIAAVFGLALRGVLRQRPPAIDPVPLTKPPRGWQIQARLELVDPQNDREQFKIGHGLVRIGREEDNDVQLVHETVHRYHAVIERTPESEFVITDVSGEDGNGVRVNGERIQRHRLRGGETIDIGRSQLKFELSEA